MKIIKTDKIVKCIYCKREIVTPKKVVRDEIYFHLSCYCKILKDTLKGLVQDNKYCWEQLRKFNSLQKEMKEETKLFQKQDLIKGLK